MRFWIKLAPGESADKVRKHWMQQGIMPHSARLHYERASAESLPHVILGFGAVSEEQIHQAFTRLQQQRRAFS
jgi:GntR family transcriptional regulator / MocR family aminotransferase